MTMVAKRGALAACVLMAMAGAAQAQEKAWSTEIVYTADVMGPVSGGASRAGRFLDNLDVVVDGDLERIAGWRGATVHAHLLNNSGGKPNDLAGTLQGVDNIEVSQARGRLYELWVEQALRDGAVSVRGGLYAVDSEFYSTEASGLLIAPSFGVGSEFASTGPNGPSIFPLTALAVRVKAEGGGRYVQAAVVNAEPASLNDAEDLQMGLDDGAILIGEAGLQGPAHVAIGAWTYTEKQTVLEASLAGAPGPRRSARGGYVLAEGPLPQRAGLPAASVFVRAGISDGQTTPFRGGWQAGVRFQGVLPGSPDSEASFGVQQGFLSGRARAAGAAEGLELGEAESGFEATLSQRFGRLTVQPDLQLIRHPSGDRTRDLAVIVGARVSLSLL
ncbi:carbohydrate porin [Phenylobacterium deserti]|uniref:Porin n=1 Tax=Phenylobacterium deserti TaxID=1914756 RepID=A0A328ASK6_9CAUL|nr:carbohydrate porin [Phenylobacterium deserti]RAK58062.1 porin [Phenylobacterium deserti]